MLGCDPAPLLYKEYLYWGWDNHKTQNLLLKIIVVEIHQICKDPCSISTYVTFTFHQSSELFVPFPLWISVYNKFANLYTFTRHNITIGIKGTLILNYLFLMKSKFSHIGVFHITGVGRINNQIVWCEVYQYKFVSLTYRKLCSH